MTFDLEDRTTKFGEEVIELLGEIRETAITRPLISQVIRAATSIGANYAEADDAPTKKDFRYRISICRKEARETKYWFRMLAKAAPDSAEAARPLWKEAHELNLIFSKIWRSSAPTSESKI